jgi:putative phosphoribosyl transferase
LIFKDRSEAGRLLAQALIEKHGTLLARTDATNAIVLAVPRGGVVVGKELAERLKLPLDLIIARKLGAPGNPEFAIGAVTQEGSVIVNEDTVRQLGISEDYIDREANAQVAEIRARMNRYRGDTSYPSLGGKIVIVVDDGIAMGLTMKAALKSLRDKNPSTLILAVPVSPPDTLNELSKLVDGTVCLNTPASFYAVGEFYQEFDQVTDDEVRAVLSRQNQLTRRGGVST